MEPSQLKSILTTRGIKQAWVADKLKISAALVNQWVKGKKTISEKHQIELRALLLN